MLHVVDFIEFQVAHYYNGNAFTVSDDDIGGCMIVVAARDISCLIYRNLASAETLNLSLNSTCEILRIVPSNT